MLRESILVLVAVVVAAASSAPAAEPETAEQKTIYAIGVAMSQSLSRYGLTEEEVGLVTQGITDGLAGKATVDVKEESANIQKLARDRAKVIADAEKKESAKFVAEMAKKPDAKSFDSGLVYIETKAGTGKQPEATDTVKVHYHGTLRDGSVFDSSKERGAPATFPLNRVIKCWTEGVQMMKEGGVATLICPSDIAYGDRGSPPKIQPGAVLVFEVELIEVQEKKAGAANPHP